MVAYHYPPEGSSSGVLRTLKFSKYLPGCGWVPHILTLRDSFYPVKDAGLLRDIPPEAVVHRTFAWDSARHLAIKGRHPALLTIPDRFTSWIPFGVARGVKVVHSEKIHALYSTSPVPSAHLIASAIKAVTGLPWVADFRDPWVEEGIHPLPGTWRYTIESFLEQKVMRRADLVLVTTPYLRGEFLSRYPALPPEKVRVIYNGYDESDFQGLDLAQCAGRFEMVHAGLVTPEYRDPLPLLETLAELLSEGALSRSELRLNFLGGSSYLDSESFRCRVDQLGLSGVVAVAGRVPHREALQRLGRASALLILQASDDTRSLIPAKAFEYLRVGRPILALTLEGATADLLGCRENCHVVNPRDRDGLRKALLKLYHQWLESNRDVRLSHPIRQYERRQLTAELAGLLAELVDHRPAVS